jgi:hypothetical protein
MNPELLYAGYDARRTYTLEKISGDDWTLSARLIGSGGTAAIEAANVDSSGTTHVLTVPSTALSGLSAGVYTLQLIATNGTTTEIVLSETVSLVADDTTDLRTSARKQLDAINAVLEGKASKDETSVSYNGRSISRMSWDELLNARDRLRRQVTNEERKAAGRSKITSVGLKFTEAS